MLKAVLFDLGGTLLHYHDSKTADHQRHFRRITIKGFEAVLTRLKELNIDLPAFDVLAEELDKQIRRQYLADLNELRGGSIESPMRDALESLGVELSDSAWRDAKGRFYDQIDEIVAPRIGVPDVLTSLAEAGYQMGLISNTYWSGPMHDRHLKEHSLLQYLPVRVYSCDAPYMKPHPGIFKMALVAMGVTPGQAVYVGDRLDVDVQGAQKVGMYGILIQSPYRMEEIDGSPPDGVTPDAEISELTDLSEALKGIKESMV